MASTRRRDTAAELKLRAELDALGLTYETDSRPITGVRRRADVVFREQRVAVFVDGCFWHACPLHATWPRANADWWRAKILANQARDRATDERLIAVGWVPVRVWEHEDPRSGAERVARALTGRPG
jgi:DNA mismatch endonuclease (patch repair protein)